MPTPRLYGKETDEKGRKLKWGTHPDGYPTLVDPNETASTPVGPDDLQKATTELEPDYRRFILPDESAEYLTIINKIVNGYAILIREDWKEDKDHPGKLFYHLTWANIHAVPEVNSAQAFTIKRAQAAQRVRYAPNSRRSR